MSTRPDHKGPLHASRAGNRLCGLGASADGSIRAIPPCIRAAVGNGARALRLSISLPGAPSRGTMNTAAAQIAQGTRVRREGTIVEVHESLRSTVDFGRDRKPTIGIT